MTLLLTTTPALAQSPGAGPGADIMATLVASPVALAILGAGGLIALGVLAVAAVAAVLLRRGTRGMVQAGRTVMQFGQSMIEISQKMAETGQTILHTSQTMLHTGQDVAQTGRTVLQTGQSMDDHLHRLLAETRENRLLIEARAESLERAVYGRTQEDAIILAHTLAGELRAIHAALELHLVRLDAFLRERREAGYTKVGTRDLLPVVAAPAFAALADRVGLLGGSLAGDVAWLYGRLDGWRQAEGTAASRPGSVALDQALEIMDIIEDIADGVLHLSARLTGFAEDKPVAETAYALVRERGETRAALAAEEAEEAALAAQLAAESAAREPEGNDADVTDAFPAPSSVPPIDDVSLGSPKTRR